MSKLARTNSNSSNHSETKRRRLSFKYIEEDNIVRIDGELSSDEIITIINLIKRKNVKKISFTSNYYGLMSWIPSYITELYINDILRNVEDDEKSEIKLDFVGDINSIPDTIEKIVAYGLARKFDKFPANLECLELSKYYNYDLIGLPDSVQIIRFDPCLTHDAHDNHTIQDKLFNHLINPLPKNLRILELPTSFNREIQLESNSRVEELIFKGYGEDTYNKPIPFEFLPNLKKLTIDSSCFNQSIDGVCDGIEEIYIHGGYDEKSFSQPIHRIPQSCKKISFYSDECPILPDLIMNFGSRLEIVVESVYDLNESYNQNPKEYNIELYNWIVEIQNDHDIIQPNSIHYIPSTVCDDDDNVSINSDITNDDFEHNEEENNE